MTPEDQIKPQSPDVDLSDAIEQLRVKKGIPKPLVDRLISQESGGSEAAVSPKGAQGSFQVMPATFDQYNRKVGGKLDRNNPLDRAYVGLSLLQDNYNQFKNYAKSDQHNWGMALAGYHAGPNAVMRDLRKGGNGIPDASDGLINTRDYVYNILSGIKPEPKQADTTPDNVGQVPTNQPKTPQVSSVVSDAQFQGPTPQEPIADLQVRPQVKPVDFKQATLGDQGKPTLNPIENLYRIAENEPKPSGTLQQQFEQRRFQAPESLQQSQRVKLAFAPHLNPSPQEVEQAYIKALGPEYDQYNKMHVAQTGQNLVSFHPEQLAQIKREPDGSFYISPRKDALDYLNAYVTSGGNLDKANEVAGQNRQAQFDAAKVAQQGAKQDVAEIEAARKSEGAEGSLKIPLPYDPLDPNAQKSLDISGRAVTGPTERFAAGIIKALGGVASVGGLAPNHFADYLNRRGEIVNLGASLPPLTAEGKEIQKNVPEKVATALGDLGYTVFSIAVAKKVTGLPINAIMAAEAGLKNSDKPAGQRATEIAKAYALGSVLEADIGRLTTGAMFAVPTGVEGAQAALQRKAKGENPDWADVLLDTGIQGGLGAILGGKKGTETPTELGIENAPVAGVQGRGALDADQTLAAREASVKPVTDSEGNVLLNPDEVAHGGKPKIKLANQPTGEAAHLANFRDRAPDGTFVEGAAKIPEEFKSENVSAARSKRSGINETKTNDTQSLPLTQESETPNRTTVPQGTGFARPADLGTKEGETSRGTVATSTEQPQLTAPPSEGGVSVPEGKPTPEAMRVAYSEALNEPVNIIRTREGDNGTAYLFQGEKSGALGVEGRQSGAEPSTTSARQSQLAADRAKLDLPELPQVERKGWRTSLQNAQDRGLDRQANRIADGVLQGHLKALDDEQTAGLVLRMQQVKNEHSGLQKQIYQADPKSEEFETLRAQNEILEAEADKLQRAMNQSGSEKGRTLAAQKLTINQDMDLVSMITRAKAKGLEITPERRAKYEAMDKEINGDPTAPEGSPERLGLKERARIAEEKAKTAELQSVTERVSRKSKRTQTKQALDDEAATIKTNIAAEFARLKTQLGSDNVRSMAGLGNLDPEGIITKNLAKYLRNRVQAGVTDAAQILDDAYSLIREHVDGITKGDVLDALLAKSRSQRTDLSIQLADVRKQLDVLAVESQQRTVRPQGPKQSEARKLPAEGPRLSEGVGAKEGPELGPRQGPKLREGFRQTEGPRLSEGQGRTEGPRLSEGVGGKEGPSLGPKQGPRPSDARKLPMEGPKITDAPKQGPTQAYFKTRKAALLKQETELQRRIAEQDFSEKAKRPPIVYNKELNDIQGRVASLRKQYQHDLDLAKPKTVGDLLVRWKRFAVLTYPQTFGKLTSAATARMISTPAEELAGSVLSKVPGLGQAFTGPREGPLNLSAETKAVSQLWQSQSFKDMLAHLKGGEDLLSLLYGKGDEFYGDTESRSLIPGKGKQGYERYADITDRPGHYHAAVKTIPKRAEFFRSFEKRLEFAKQQGRDTNDPAVQMGIAGEAYVDAQRAILQQPNPLSEAFNRAVQGLAHSDYRINRALSRIARFEFPITRVPVNFATETAQNIGGLPAGLGEVAARGISGKVKPFFTESKSSFLRSLGEKMPDALNELEPEQKDRIARMLKKGTIGSAFVLWGMLKPDQFGGYYQPGKREPGDVKAGGMRFLGVNIPRWMGHIPLLEAAQFGATLRRVFDSMRAKEKTKAEAIEEGGKAAVTGLAKEVPFVQPFIEGVRAFKQPLGVTAGEQVKGLEPGAGQWAARATDYGPDGSLVNALNPFSSQETVKRQQKTFSDVVKEGVPGLRETIPVSDVFPKPSKGSSEVQRLGVWLDGAKKSKDESLAEFQDRREVENKAIREAIDSVVANPDYAKLSDKQKAEQIKAAKTFAVKMTPKPVRKIKDLAPALMAAPSEPSSSPNLLY